MVIRMGKASTNQKLQLIRSIREESRDNRMKMRHREKILYGIDYHDTEHKTDREPPLWKKGYYEGGEGELYALEEDGMSVQGTSFSSFKLRMILSVVLFCLFLTADAGDGKIAGISTEYVREEINKDFDADFEEVVFDFENNFPYTLFKD